MKRDLRIFGGIAALALTAMASSQQVKIAEIGWTPPQTSIEKHYVDAVRALVGNGLSDPRRGTFSLVRVKVGNAAWSGIVERDAFGWVLPGAKQVVAVDGLTYPVVKVVREAKLSEVGDASFGRDINGMAENAVPLSSRTIALPGLLLLRGEVNLAEEFYKPTKNSAWSSALLLYGHLVNRYRMQVAQCLMDGKDQEALPWARGFAAVSAVRIAAKVNYPDDTVGWKLSDDEPRIILQDVMRRAANPKKPLDPDALAKLDQKTRIATLISRLDEIGARQWGQPGGIHWMGEPSLGLLVQEGEAAIPAILDTIEKDERLTRSVSFGRDFGPQRTIQPVRVAALMALQTIWPSSSTLVPHGIVDIKKLREAWNDAAALSEPERWLAVLRDDGAGYDAWLTAGKALTSPVNQRQVGSNTAISGAPSPQMKGEPIRAKLGADAVRLMGTRAEQMTRQLQRTSGHIFFEAGAGLRLAHCLSKWDSKAALPYLQQASRNAMAIPTMWGEGGDDQFNDHLGSPLAILITDRLHAGDRTALADYAWLADRFKPSFSQSEFQLRPVWMSLNDPEVQAIGEKFYARLRENMHSDDRPTRNTALQSLDDLVYSPLILAPGFRRFLAECIGDNAYAGQSSIEEYNGYVSVRYSLGPNGGSGSRGIGQAKDLDQSLYTKEALPFSTGDYVAETLAGLKGSPRFSMAMKTTIRSERRKQVLDWLVDPKVDWSEVVKSLSYNGWD